MGNAKSLTGFKKREKFLIFFKQFEKSIQISCIGIFIKIADIAGIFLFFYPCAKRSLRCICICVSLLKSGKNGSPGRGENPAKPMSFGKLQLSPTKNAQAFHKKQCRRELQKAALCRFSKVRAVYSKPFLLCFFA